jgi:predicted nucleic acid-binding Zn ribbon protein
VKRDLACELFRSYRAPLRKKSKSAESERVHRDDPTPLSQSLSELVKKEEWQSGLAEGNLFSTWETIVGKDIAEHSSPITLLDGCLTIQSSTTAWATQLRLLAPDILKTIQQNTSGALVEELKIVGPSAPSWRRGLRTIRGARGPRDTYG